MFWSVAAALLWGFFTFIMWVCAILVVKALVFFFGPAYWWLLAFPAIGTLGALVAVVSNKE